MKTPPTTAHSCVRSPAAILSLAFAVVGLRLVDITLMQDAVEPRAARAPQAETLQFARADIVDRNGVLLATNLPTASLYADPRQVIEPADAARRLAGVLPGLIKEKLAAKLASKRAFCLKMLSRSAPPSPAVPLPVTVCIASSSSFLSRLRNPGIRLRWCRLI